MEGGEVEGRDHWNLPQGRLKQVTEQLEIVDCWLTLNLHNIIRFSITW